MTRIFEMVYQATFSGLSLSYSARLASAASLLLILPANFAGTPFLLPDSKSCFSPL